MSAFINFNPGDMRQVREITVSDDPAYYLEPNLGGFLASMRDGCTASMRSEGVKDALCDGALLGVIAEDYAFTDAALQDVVEELHAAI